MCESEGKSAKTVKTIGLNEAVGSVLSHDITEISEKHKGCAFKKGHVVREEDICHLQRLGKEHFFVLNIGKDEMHEDDAAYALANALAGDGVDIGDAPKEGKINLIAARDGLLKVEKETLLAFNMLGDVMCATLHNNTLVKKGSIVAGTRAIPLVIKRSTVEDAVKIAGKNEGVIKVKEMRKPKAGIVVTGNEVYYQKIKDAFAPVIAKKIESFGGEVMKTFYAPDDKGFISERIKELIDMGADLIITTGGMSVDPDDVTRFAIKKLGASDFIYGSAVLPGAMFLIAYITPPNPPLSKGGQGGVIPILGIPVCGMHNRTTVFDLILPRILAGERPGRRELAELGHGGLCIRCEPCRYPVCPFGKQ